MIVAVSTSSPQAGVALLRADGSAIGSDARIAPSAAGGACLEMLDALLRAGGLRLEDATLFLADLGPGSFTGVRVGVTLAKTWGLAFGKPVAGASSFDLVDAGGTVVLPSKKGEYFVRVPGCEPVRTKDLPNDDFVGYGSGVTPAVYPSAERFAPLIGSLTLLRPEELLPNYVLEPSISVPKKPYGAGGAGG